MKLNTLITAFLLSFGAALGAPVDFDNATMIDIELQPSNLHKRSHNGVASVYNQQGGTGSCGHVHNDGDHVVSIAQQWYDKYGMGSLCGRRMKVRNIGHATDDSVGGQGNIIYPKITDTCSACSSDPSHLDLSVGSWDKLTNNHGLSVVKVHWYFCGIGGEC